MASSLSVFLSLFPIQNILGYGIAAFMKKNVIIITVHPPMYIILLHLFRLNNANRAHWKASFFMCVSYTFTCILNHCSCILCLTFKSFLWNCLQAEQTSLCSLNDWSHISQSLHEHEQLNIPGKKIKIELNWIKKNKEIYKKGFVKLVIWNPLMTWYITNYVGNSCAIYGPTMLLDLTSSDIYIYYAMFSGYLKICD